MHCVGHEIILKRLTGSGLFLLRLPYSLLRQNVILPGYEVERLRRNNNEGSKLEKSSEKTLNTMYYEFKTLEPNHAGKTYARS